MFLHFSVLLLTRSSATSEVERVVGQLVV